jgi:diadenosine tetraphosphate (Ap4A) HIT family hydrolase
MACELCDSPGGDLVWQNALCRVVRVNDPHYPGFCRVILNRHVKEMSDLPESDRQAMMHVVFAVEQALTILMHPDKINLASLGNLVPHVHWHIIPRFSDDAHFPQPIWAAPARVGGRRTAPEIEILRNTLDELL